jgi:excisionase family DNA binding protein
MGISGKATFTLGEAAELLSCHRETLRKAIRDGELRAAKLGREFRISFLELEAFWTACGGGDLFPKGEDLPVREPEVKEVAPLARKQTEAPKQQQLSLLPVSGEMPDKRE